MPNLWIPPTPVLFGTDFTERVNNMEETLNKKEKDANGVLKTAGSVPHAKNDEQHQKPHIPSNSPLLVERYRGTFKVNRQCPEGLLDTILFPL